MIYNRGARFFRNTASRPIKACIFILADWPGLFFTARVYGMVLLRAVLPIGIRIQIHRIHMFLGLPDPDLDSLVRGMETDPDPALDPSIIMQK
jgi:hypothetical protein